ncbi:MAG TPA: alkaline phosphatase family protein [Candidatus Sulfotelmatobacter sp.]|nr:alkaline phosphatase family protein [Candidatus Sulfotelmatobacter sp.]
MKRITAVLALLACFAATGLAQEGAVPKGIPPLNHVWVIMMENHGFVQVLNNPAAPFTTQYASSANLATNYFAVAHPSLTNYLETNGGSNFGVLDDNSTDWHNASCTPNIASGVINFEADSNPICPIAGTGTDAATPLLDCFNEVTGPPCDIEIDGVHTYAADPNILGISIADQLVAAGKTWKSYQESLPLGSADLINYSDGNFTNLTDFTLLNSLWPATPPTFNPGQIVQLYAVKHNPFVYFKSTQEGTTPGNSLANVAPFDGAGGLYGDLASGKVPNYSFIAPNQCNDQHGRGNGTQFCQFDPNDNGTQVGLNPALMALGDQALQRIVTAIHASPAWTRGHNAIVTIWDEDDYSVSPTINQVAAIVDTNYGFRQITSNQFYTHFSLLRSIEGGFRLPCLNHACDASTQAMTDLFGEP